MKNSLANTSRTTLFPRLLALMLTTLLILTPVCSMATTSNNASQSLTKLTVSEVTHSVFYAPQYVAINLGFFEKNGIEVELINSQGADKVMAAVLSGQVEIGFAQDKDMKKQIKTM